MKSRVLKAVYVFVAIWIVFAVISCFRLTVRHDKEKDVWSAGHISNAAIIAISMSAVTWLGAGSTSNKSTSNKSS